jgi:hypothetical protein
MKDAYEILRLKEIELLKVKAEVEALGIVTSSMKGPPALTARGLGRPDCAAAAMQVPKGSRADPPDHTS